jgi:phosphate transport system ATP-binding protein
LSTERSEPPTIKLEAVKLRAWFSAFEVLRGVSLAVHANQVTAVIGPSGCGKSTFVRCLNRLHELATNAGASGKVLLDGKDIYQGDAARVRRRIGMVFQKPNPFPHLSIEGNVLAGVRINGLYLDDQEGMVERALRQVALWDEVKDELWRPGHHLSGGQQQRLCLARALATGPEVILMDEPCSSLDPVATAKVEELIRELGERYTILIVTHNMQQAARVSDRTAFFYMGEVIEYDTTDVIFTAPNDPRTEDYITGRFG